MVDKLFFVERVPGEVTVFADFGCADGYLLRQLHMERREWPGGWDCHFIGYDHNPDMIREAKARRTIGVYEFTSDFAMFAARLDRHHRLGRKSCLVLSSVVHEVLSQDPLQFEAFWHNIRLLGCDYIAVRDMAVEERAHHVSPEPAEYAATWDNDRIRTVVYNERPTRAGWLQALLKADYADNFENELRENYFPLTAEQWLNFTTIGTGYKLRHFEHAPLAFLQRKWREQYGIYVPDPTHIKLLLQKEA
ncbi:hypothetical protein [Aminobacter sp. HY435]|uniref:hypothetical protein n=1 Tax=Aminobacter sp. HY435 TaxID=2970917 RepID=UPI0022B9A6F3|nr:hypothetical protein [Aminobacter sp. HY435]